MAKVSASGLNFTAKLSTEEALKRAKEFTEALRKMKKEAGVADFTVPTPPSVRPITNYQQAQLKLQESLRDARLETVRLTNTQKELEAELSRSRNVAQGYKNQVEQLKVTEQELKNQYRSGLITLQQYAQQLQANKVAQQALNAQLTEAAIKDKQAATALKEYNLEQKRLADAARAARQANQAASGSYKEAQQRLTALGNQIKNTTNGFNSQSPALKAQIREYNELNDKLKAFDAQMGNHQRNVGNYKSVLTGLHGQLASLLGAYVSVQGVIQVAGDSFQSNLKLDAVKTSLEFTLGSVEAADKKLNELKGTSDRLGLSFTPLVASYASFAGAARAANFPLTETNKIFNSIAGAGARFHLTADQISGSLLAVQQMISKGTVQSEELRGQLGERLPGAFSIAARAMGVTEKELGKLLQTGQVLAADLIPKLGAELDKTFKLDTATKIDTLTASTNRLSTAYDTALQGDGIGKFFKQFIEGATNALVAVDRLIKSRSFAELRARVFTFNGGEVYDKINAVSDNYNNSVATQRANNINPLGSPDKIVVSTLMDQSFEDLEKLRNKYLEAAKQAEQAVNIYKKGLKSGDLENGGKILVSDAEKNFKRVQATLTLINTAYFKLNKQAKAETKTLTDDQLKSIDAIRKRITELSKLDGSAIDGNPIHERIEALKERLKAVTGSAKDELSARNTLQKQIDSLTKRGTDKQLTADEQEVESVKKKYEDMKAAADKFNNDPANRKKGIRVNAGGLLRAQDRELIDVRDKHETARLKVTLEDQKKLYEEYEQFKNQVGEENAKKRFAKLIDVDKTYLESLQARRDELINPDKGKGGADVADAASVKRRLALLDEEIAEEKTIKEKRDAEYFADAYQAALTHSQRLLLIDEEYARRRAALGDSASEEQVAQLTRDRDYKIRAEAEANAFAKGGFEELMLNYDAMTRQQILKKLKLIKDGYEQEYKIGSIVNGKLVRLTAEQFAGLTRDIDDQINKINGNNIFKRISASIEKYREQVKLMGKNSTAAKSAQQELFLDIADGAQEANNVVSTLASSFAQLGIGGEGLQDALTNIQGIISGAGSIAKGISSGNPIDIVTGSINLLTSAVSLFDRKDKNLQKKIDAYKRELDSLGRAYAQLDRAVQNSVGESVYTDQLAQISNLQQQQAKLTQMRDAEVAKKKTDEKKVQEFQNQIDSIPGQIADIQQAISQNLIQTTFKDLSNTLADALSEAFAAGEDAADRFDDAFDKMIVNAVKNSLKLKILEPIISDFTDELTEYAKKNDNSIVGFDFETWRKAIKEKGDLYTEGLKAVEQYMPDGSSSTSSAANNNIKQITTEQASALEGILRGSYDIQKQLLAGQRVYVAAYATNHGEVMQSAMAGIRHLEAIEFNTAATVSELQNAVSELKSINANTKPGIGGRSSGFGI